MGHPSPDHYESIASLEEWLSEHGPAWAAKVRDLFGDTADDCLAMIGVGT